MKLLSSKGFSRVLIKSSEWIAALIFGLALIPTALSSSYTLTHEKQTIQVTMDSDISGSTKSMLMSWLRHSTDALKTVYGEWPNDRLNIEVKAGRSSYSPVPWGEVRRGKPPKVILVVDQRQDLNNFKEDWTVYHELSHLLIPYDGGGHRWFSEGLASYYQNILQARIGMFDERKMWQKLYDGFERGRKQVQWSHLNLADLSDGMRENRNFMRIYWSGALYWLELDLALRQLSPPQSLDNALLKLRNCCAKESLTAQQLCKKLDEVTGTDLFEKYFHRYRDSHAIPGYGDLMKGMGIRVVKGRVELIDEGHWVKARRAIYSGS